MSIEEFGKTHGLDLSDIINARKISDDNIQKIKDAVSKGGISPFGNDMDLVVFGSIARGECTSKSDVDWTLLMDGQSNPRYDSIALDIKEKIRNTGLYDPGTFRENLR
jgi:predicted nucleotidyltransferase